MLVAAGATRGSPEVSGRDLRLMRDAVRITKVAMKRGLAELPPGLIPILSIASRKSSERI